MPRGFCLFLEMKKKGKKIIPGPFPLVREENRVKAEKIDFDEKMDKFDGVIAAHQSKMEHWRREMAKLRLHPVGDADPGQLQVLFVVASSR